MKTHTPNLTAKAGLRQGFTLVEMITVVAVIGILAGIMLGAAGAAQRKAMSSRTQATIQQLCAGCDMRKADHEAWLPDYRANWRGSSYETVWPAEALWYWLYYYYAGQESSAGTKAAKEAYIRFRPDQIQDSGKLIDGRNENYMRVVDAWGNPINYKSQDGNSYYFDAARPGEGRSNNPRHNRGSYDLCSYGANGTTWREKDKQFNRAQDLNMGGGGSSRPPDYFFRPFDTLGGGSDGHCYGGEDGDDINNWQNR